MPVKAIEREMHDAYLRLTWPRRCDSGSGITWTAGPPVICSVP